MNPLNSSILITEADYHRPECLKGAELRAYVIMQSLFFDQVVVGDTQFNNNKWLRALISRDEPDEGLLESVPRDFHRLLKDGHLVPALRSDYDSLEELRQEHIKRNLRAAPSEQYTAWVSELLGDHRVTFRLAEASYVFKQRVLEELAVPSNLPSVSEKMQLELYEFVIKQEPLLFHGLLDWMKAKVQQDQMSNAEFEAIDVLVGNCYRHNIGFVIDSNVDFLASHLDRPGYMALSFGDHNQSRKSRAEFISKEISFPPYAFLSVNTLSSIPAGVVSLVKGELGTRANEKTPYHEFSKAVDKFKQSNDSWNPEELATACERYCNEIDYICQEYLRGTALDGYLQIRNRAKQGMVLRLLSDGATRLLSLIPPIQAGVQAIKLSQAAYGAVNAMTTAEATRNKQLDAFLMGRLSKREPLFKTFK